jgi:hypothetical protein
MCRACNPRSDWVAAGDAERAKKAPDYWHKFYASRVNT